jgi:hypothetical protein
MSIRSTTKDDWLCKEQAESGAGAQTIMDIAWHVSRQMLARYSHIRMEAKRAALEGIVSKPEPAPKGQLVDLQRTMGP